MIHRIDNGSIYCYYYCIQIPCTYFNFIHVIVRKYFFSFPNCYDKLHTYENAAVVIFQCNAGRLLMYWISVLSSPLLFIWVKWRGVGRFWILCCWTPKPPNLDVRTAKNPCKFNPLILCSLVEQQFKWKKAIFMTCRPDCRFHIFWLWKKSINEIFF